MSSFYLWSLLAQVVYQDFSTGLDSGWQSLLVGQGRLESTGTCLRFVNADTSSRHYTNAQIDDYRGLARRNFLWHPPLRLVVRARFSHPAGELEGTAGFGFWNDPFLMSGPRIPALPRANWFFYASPPANIKLDMHAPGCGWKATTIDALRPAALLLAPLAPWAALLMNFPSCYSLLWPPIQRALNIREVMVGAGMTEWHTYAIEWGREYSRFSVDRVPLLEKAPSPRGPLGFVIWLDNQYLVITPWGRLRWGLLDTPGCQWMEVDHFSILPM